MANDREFSVILKATDLSSQSITQVVEAVKKLTDAQKANNDAASAGKIKNTEFKDSLQTLLTAVQGLTSQQAALQRFIDQQAVVAKQTEAVAAARAKLNEELAKTPPDADPTDKQTKAVQRLEKSVEAAQKRYEAASGTLAKYGELLNKLGVVADSDKRTVQLLRDVEKATLAVDAAREKLNAKVVASPEDERTKQQAYSIRRLQDALESAQRKADQARMSLENYQGVKLNEAVVQQQERIRHELEAVVPTIQRANAETLTLTANRQKATEAAAEQAKAEKLLADQAKAAAEAADRENAGFAARNRAQQAAETGRFAKGGVIDQSSAAASAASELSLRNTRQSAFMDAIRDQEEQAASLKAARERDAAADAEFVARKRAEAREASAQQIGIDKSSAAAAAANELSLRNVRRSAFEEAIADHEQQVAANKAANAAEEADNRAFVERQRTANKERIEVDQKLLVEQERINTERANLRRFDFQQAVEEQAREEALAQQRAAAAKEQQARLEQLLASQEKIARAQAAIPTSVGPGAVTQPSSNFAESITAIIAPAQAARQTLGGIEKQIDAISVGMATAKLRSEDFDKVLRDLGATFGALQRQANLVEVFRRQQEALTRLLTELKNEERVMIDMTLLHDKATVYNEKQTRDLLDQTNKVKALTAAYNAQNAAFSETKAAAQSAGIDINNLAASEARITAAALRGKDVLANANVASGRGNDFTFLGLRPYELQNLSYQINDVFTQLGSGTSITQTLAQQGGQIFQLFQRQIAGAVGALAAMPLVLAAVSAAIAAATIAIFTFIRAIDVMAEKRKTMSSLAQDVDGSRYSVEKLVEASKGLTQLGVGLSDAAEGARELANAGIAPEKVAPLQRLAALMSAANGTKFSENIKALREAFAGTGQDLVKWATQVNHLLDTDQFKRVQEAVDQGDILTARATVFEIANKRMTEAAEKNTSQVVKAFREFKQAWNDLLDSLGSNRVVRWFGDRIVDTLTQSLNLMRALLDAGRALSELNFKNLNEALGRNLTPGAGDTTGVASVSGQRPGETPEFVALRDRVADAVGISREAFRLLQQSEGKWDARANKWSDALDKAGNVIENGGKGAAQVVQSTFDEMKKKYPDLIKGDVHDVTANLMAGALYFREMAQQGSNVFAKAVEGYKQGPGVAFGSAAQREAALAGISPESAAANRNSIRGLSGQFTGPVITRTGAPQTLESTPQVALVTPPAEPQLPASQRQGVATEQFRKAQQEIVDSQQKAFADEDKLYEIFTRDLTRAAEKVHRDAEEAAKQSGAAQIDQKEETAKVEAAQDEVRRQYHQAWLARQEEQANKYKEISQRALSYDKTNFDARMHLLELQQAAERAALDKEQNRGLFKNAPPGQTIEEVRALMAQTQAQERTNLSLDVAKEIITAVTEQRDKQLAEIRAKAQIAPPSEQAALFAEQNRLFLSFLPKINDAVKLANGILAGLPPTEAVREAQARNALVQQQARRPEAIGTGEAAAVSAISAPLQSAVEQNRSGLENIVESVKVSGVSASAALDSIFNFTKKTLADLKTITASTNEGLQAVLAQPGVTPAEKEKLQAQIQANLNAPGKAAVDAQNAILAVIAEDKQKLDKLLEEYKKAVTDLDAKIRDGRLKPLAAAAERARIDAASIPEIGAAGRQVQGDIAKAQSGAQQLGLSPGFRAGLAAEGQTAATVANEQTLASASARDRAQKSMEIGKTSLNTMNETIRTQQELLKLGATTQTEAENATKDAHLEAMKAVKALEPEIQKNIDALNALGDNQGAKKLAADFKLLQTQVEYIDPLVQKITTGLEQSFTGRGYQAIETIAKSFAKLITGQEKFKDLLKDTAGAFATFTAGVLQDVAKIIIEYTLLKVIKDALGVGPGVGAAASGASSGASGGLFGSLFGAGAGAAAGAGASAAFGTTTATAAGAVSADTILSAGVGSGAFILHGGGTVGRDGMSRVVDLSVFRDAQRFHSGGMVLARDEVPIIAQRGEKIVSLAQQRTDAAQKVAQKTQEGTSIRNVLAVGDKEVASAMNTSHGEKVVLNIMQRNAPSIKKWVG